MINLLIAQEHLRKIWMLLREKKEREKKLKRKRGQCFPFPGSGGEHDTKTKPLTSKNNLAPPS